VLAEVQRFRRQAQAAGHLKSFAKQVVKTEKEIIIIEPADPQVICVPQYNPTTVVVYSAAPVYAYHPTPCPSYHHPYPAGAAFATGVIRGAAIGAARNGNHYNINDSGNANSNINNTINTGHIDTRNTNVNRSSSASPQSTGGSSGAMSFIVSHHRVVFEKNLGQDTATVGARISAFDPGAGWKPVTP
jgi:hypothetical protein